MNAAHPGFAFRPWFSLGLQRVQKHAWEVNNVTFDSCGTMYPHRRSNRASDKTPLQRLTTRFRVPATSALLHWERGRRDRQTEMLARLQCSPDCNARVSALCGGPAYRAHCAPAQRLPCWPGPAAPVSFCSPDACGRFLQFTADSAAWLRSRNQIVCTARITAMAMPSHAVVSAPGSSLADCFMYTAANAHSAAAT